SDENHDADAPHEQTFRNWAETAERVTTRAWGFLGRLDEGDDVLLLIRGELTIRELRHVLRTGQHGLVDLLLVGRVQDRSVLTGRQCATTTGEVMAGSA